MRISILFSIIFYFITSLNLAYPKDIIPQRAYQYIPQLLVEIDRHWIDRSEYISFFPAQVEQETCINNTYCWNPRAENKRGKEYGFGLGQITVVQGRFNKFQELKDKFNELKNWEWEDRFNYKFQLEALILEDKFNYIRIQKTEYFNQLHLYAFMFSAYNGGLGAVLQDKEYCKSIKNCDKSKWFNNVEKYSLKSKYKLNNYSKSAFEINREYVKNIIFIRSPKYFELFKKMGVF
jgi:hypothetical protein